MDSIIKTKLYRNEIDFERIITTREGSHLREELLIKVLHIKANCIVQIILKDGKIKYLCEAAHENDRLQTESSHGI
jgi:hypothetical protein